MSRPDVTVAAPFSMNVDEHALAIDVGAGQAADFADAQAGAISGHDNSPMFQLVHGLDEVFDLLQA